MAGGKAGPRRFVRLLIRVGSRFDVGIVIILAVKPCPHVDPFRALARLAMDISKPIFNSREVQPNTYLLTV